MLIAHTVFWGIWGCSSEQPGSPSVHSHEDHELETDDEEHQHPGGDADDGDCTNTFPVDESPHTHEGEHGQALPPREDALPTLLSETGLYVDIASKEIHTAMQSFTPQYPLWSDGAEKYRWVYIPECGAIDSSNMDDWSFPVGTRLFKEFQVDGVRIETRIIERIGDGPRDFVYASYLWNEEESEATRVAEEGLEGAKGTEHNIPSKSECLRCHGSYALGGGRPSRALGFSALQLSHQSEGLTLDDLVEAARLTEAPAQAFGIPGSSTEKAALGYLHANCGHCHNDTKDTVPHVDLSLWVDVDVAAVEQSAAWQTAVDQPNLLFHDQHVSGRLVPGNPSESALYYRMKQRGNAAQMPPIATRIADTEGLAAISTWIEGLQ
jgi:hypothetical protein